MAGTAPSSSRRNFVGAYEPGQLSAAARGRPPPGAPRVRRHRLLAVAAPAEDHDDRVVLKRIALVSQEAAQQPANGSRSRYAVGEGRLHEVGQPVLAEELPGGSGLDDAVGRIVEATSIARVGPARRATCIHRRVARPASPW